MRWHEGRDRAEELTERLEREKEVEMEEEYGGSREDNERREID